MKTSKKDFEFFVRECKKWGKILELADWDIRYFHEERKSNALAVTLRDLQGRAASVYLSTDWDEVSHEALTSTAKHEMIHLLVGRLAGNAFCRFITEDDLMESEEALVVKLSKLIK